MLLYVNTYDFCIRKTELRHHSVLIDFILKCQQNPKKLGNILGNSKPKQSPFLKPVLNCRNFS